MRSSEIKEKTGIFVFRGDANPDVGLGHLNRLAILARAVAACGGRVFFAVKETAREMIDSKHLAGLCVIKIPRETKNIEECEYIETKILSGRYMAALDKVLVTSRYDVKNDYFARAAARGWKTVFFDDINGFRADCDVIINANMFAAELGYEKAYKGTRTRLLLGPAYYQVREEFAGAAGRFKNEREHPVILVTMGGSDYYNVTGKIARALDKMTEKFELWVLIGSANRRRAEIKDLCLKGLSRRVYVFEDNGGLADLFAGCDAAVTAGGGTNYEMIYLGKPVITFPMTANEKLNSALMERRGFGFKIVLNSLVKNMENENMPEGPAAKLRGYVRALLDEKERSAISSRIKKAAAGFFQTEKLALELMKLQIERKRS